MFPARQGADALKPVTDVRMPVPVDGDLVVEEQVRANRQVGDGRPFANHETAAGKVGIQHLPGASERLRKLSTTALSVSGANWRRKR